MHGWSCDKIPSLLLFTATHDGVEVSLCQALIHHGLRLTTDINNIDYHHQCLYHTCVWYWKEQSIPLVPSNFAWPLSIVLFPTKKGSFTHSGVDQIDWPRFQPLKCCALHPPSSNLWPSWSVHYPLHELVPHLCLGSNERFSIFFQHLWEFCFEILRKEKELPWDSLRIAHFPLRAPDFFDSIGQVTLLQMASDVVAIGNLQHLLASRIAADFDFTTQQKGHFFGEFHNLATKEI